MSGNRDSQSVAWCKRAQKPGGRRRWGAADGREDCRTRHGTGRWTQKPCPDVAVAGRSSKRGDARDVGGGKERRVVVGEDGQLVEDVMRAAVVASRATDRRSATNPTSASVSSTAALPAPPVHRACRRSHPRPVPSIPPPRRDPSRPKPSPQPDPPLEPDE